MPTRPNFSRSDRTSLFQPPRVSATLVHKTKEREPQCLTFRHAGIPRRSAAGRYRRCRRLARHAGIVRAQGGPLKVGVLLPRSGVQALIGQDCQRAVELAPPILKSLGLPELAIMNADTETNVDVARSRAERLISEGRAAADRRVRLGPDQRHRPGRRAEGHPVRGQYRGRAADHRAGLQVRVPQLPDRADDSHRRLQQSEGGVRRRRAQRPRASCCCT